MEYIVSAYRNLKRKGIRTLLTVLSISIGVASALIISVISETGKTAVNNELDSFGINGISLTGTNNKGISALENKDLEFVRSFPEIQSAMPVVNSMGYISYFSEKITTLLWGIDSGADQVISLEVAYGRVISKSDVFASSNVCLIDLSTAKQLFKRENCVGSILTLNINGVIDDFKVVGIAKPDSGLLQSVAGEYIPTFIYIPYTTLQQNIGTNLLSQIALKIDDNYNNDIDNIAKRVELAVNIYKSSDSSIRADNLVKQRGKLSNMLNIVTLVLTVISSVSLIVAGLGIMTVMLVSVTERTREIGIKKAIGAKKSNIMKEFLIESTLISVTGSVIGILFCIIITIAASLILDYRFSVTIEQALVSLLIALLCGIIFGVYPAHAAAKLSPVEALRRE